MLYVQTTNFTSLPDQISSLYPLILIISLLSFLVPWMVFGALRRLRILHRNRDVVSVPLADNGSLPTSMEKSTVGARGFWANVYFYFEKAAATYRESEVQRLGLLVSQLTHENAKLRSELAAFSGRSQAAFSDREMTEARLRAADAELLTERAARKRSDSRTSDLEEQLRAVTKDVQKTYRSVAGSAFTTRSEAGVTDPPPLSPKSKVG